MIDPSQYGLTDQGFVRMRLPEIRQLLIEDFKRRLLAAGYSDDIQTRPDSVLGLTFDTFAERHAAVWELLEGVYLSLYPSSAQKAALDRAVSFTGVSRLGALWASVFVVLYGTIGTVVPAGTRVRNSVTQVEYATIADRTIGDEICDVTLGVRTVQANTAYTVMINGGGQALITTGAAPTAQGIITALMGAIVPPTGIEVSSTATSIRIVSTTVAPFTIAASPNLSMLSVGSRQNSAATAFVDEQANPGDVSQIVTMVPGLVAVNNLLPGTPGRAEETDGELRARYDSGIFRLGAGTPESIRANLMANVPGLSFCNVQENSADTLDSNGNAPHSIRVIVDGGTDMSVAYELFRVKGAGIDTNGAIRFDVTDSQGVSHPIYLDRATPVFVWVQADVTLLPSSEEAFPSNGLALVAQAIIDAGNQFGIGKDVVYQRLESAALKVSGVAYCYVKVWGTLASNVTPPVSAYGSNNLEIAAMQVARFDLSRISVE